MKMLRRLLVVCALVACVFTAAAADKAPALAIDGALKIAQDYLKEKGEPRAIVALTLETPTLGGAAYWFAKWASPILGGDKPELGLRIAMNGDLTKVVGGGAVPAPGQRRFGAREMR